MSGTDIEVRRIRTRQWHNSADGKRKTLAGRWSNPQIREVLIERNDEAFTLDDLARLVYGTTNKTNRMMVSRRISLLRIYMLATHPPLVTFYGPHGTITAVKAYNPNLPDDVRRTVEELERLRSRQEITEERYLQLREILGLK